MSRYQLHRCIYDFVRASAVASGATSDFDAGRYELSADERKAFDNRDVAALYQMGLHPVLLNGFCRAVGFARDDYRMMLAPLGKPDERKARWQR